MTTPSTDFNKAKPQSPAVWDKPAANDAVLSAALTYADRGWHVFPVSGLHKTPMIEGWPELATTDAAQIRAWWKHWPNAMIGVATGEKSRLWVLDVDIDEEKGIDGRPILKGWEREFGKLPTTIAAETPRGGRHYWFHYHEGVRNKAGRKEMRGVDWRGEGGYVVAPPSVKADGKAYTWWQEPDWTDLNGAPEWLLDKVLKKPTISERAAPKAPLNGPWSAGRGYGAAALEAECRDLASTMSGSRNDRLNVAAFSLAQLVAGGELGEAKVKSALMEAAGACGLIKDDGRPSVEKTIWSGFNAGLGHPRKAPERPASDINETPASEQARAQEQAKAASLIRPTPFVWRDPATFPRRQWLLGHDYCRKYISGLISPGASGKSSLLLIEALVLVTGRPLLGVKPRETVKVWYFNGEDPLEETERRLLAAMKHYGIPPAEVEGRLFIDSGRDTPISIAETGRDGTRIATPMVEAIIAGIKDRDVGCMMVDPFVSTHGVGENDNVAINLVAKQWGVIADRTNAAIGLAHHARKPGGETVTTETSRGASSLMDAVRIGRAINKMTKAQAEEVGVEEPNRYFRIGGADSPGKHNLAPPIDKTLWFHLASVDLGNGHPSTGNPFADAGNESWGDHVAVVTTWEPKKLLDHVETVAQLDEIQRKASAGRWRFSHQAQGEPWIGKLIADVLDCDLVKEGHRKRVRKLLTFWIDKNALEIYEAKDSHGEFKKYVRGGSGE